MLVAQVLGDPVQERTRQFLSRVVFPRDATTDDFRSASALHRLTDDVPEFLVVHGTNDSLANIEQARSFVKRLREINPGKVAYLELPHTQHAFEVFNSIRSVNTIRAVQRWLDWHYAQWQEREQGEGSARQSENPLADDVAEHLRRTSGNGQASGQ